MTANVWFTSDTHFGHKFVAGLRGFDSVSEHDEAIVEQWQKHVKHDDQVWHLGDAAIEGQWAHGIDTVRRLNGTKHLITGNHDRCWPGKRDSHKYFGLYAEAYDSIQQFARRRINGLNVMLSHFPYTRDRAEVRHMQYRLRDQGLPLIHGHTHSNESNEYINHVHVGVDAWDWRPVNLDEVSAILNENGW